MMYKPLTVQYLELTRYTHCLTEIYALFTVHIIILLTFLNQCNMRYPHKNSQAVKKWYGLKRPGEKKVVKSKVAAKKWLQ